MATGTHKRPLGITFDRGGVLVMRDTFMTDNPILQFSEKVHEMFGIDPAKWRQGMKASNEGYDLGQYSPTERMQSILGYVGRPDISGIATLLEIETYFESRRAILNPQIGVLSQITGTNIAIGLCSNASPREAAVDSTLGLPQHISGNGYSFTSHMKVKKPDSAAYIRACALIGLSPTDCWHVDDGADGSLQGAKDAGLTVVYYHHPTGYGYSHPNKVEGAFDFQITQLVELLPLLDI